MVPPWQLFHYNPWNVRNLSQAVDDDGWTDANFNDDDNGNDLGDNGDDFYGDGDADEPPMPSTAHQNVEVASQDGAPADPDSYEDLVSFVLRV